MAYADLILEIFTYSSNLELPFKALVLVRSHFKHLAQSCMTFHLAGGRMLSNLNNVKPPNSPCPLVHDKSGQGHLDLSVQPPENPKNTAFPDMILQRGASPWEYELCFTVQSHSLLPVVTPCSC